MVDTLGGAGSTEVPQTAETMYQPESGILQPSRKAASLVNPFEPAPDGSRTIGRLGLALSIGRELGRLRGYHESRAFGCVNSEDRAMTSEDPHPVERRLLRLRKDLRSCFRTRQNLIRHAMLLQ